MKNSNNLLLYISIILMLASFNANSQSFTPASVTPCSTYVSGQPTKTGNDIFYDNINNETYRVSAYDALYPDYGGFTYVKTNWLSQNISNKIQIAYYGYDIRGIDICLVHDAAYTDIHALVTYIITDALFSSGSTLIMEDYVWSSGAFNYNSTPIIHALSTSASDVNIDANAAGEFAIIYDDQGVANFYTGYLSGGVVYINNSYLPVNTGIYGVFPDLSISIDYNNSGTPTIYFSIVSSVSNDLEVYKEPFTNIVNNSYSYNPRF